jgi:hypothetical protein
MHIFNHNSILVEPNGIHQAGKINKRHPKPMQLGAKYPSLEEHRE